MRGYPARVPWPKAPNRRRLLISSGSRARSCARWQTCWLWLHLEHGQPPQQCSDRFVGLGGDFGNWVTGRSAPGHTAAAVQQHLRRLPSRAHRGNYASFRAKKNPGWAGAGWIKRRRVAGGPAALELMQGLLFGGLLADEMEDVHHSPDSLQPRCLTGIELHPGRDQRVKSITLFAATATVCGRKIAQPRFALMGAAFCDGALALLQDQRFKRGKFLLQLHRSRAPSVLGRRR